MHPFRNTWHHVVLVLFSGFLLLVYLDPHNHPQFREGFGIAMGIPILITYLHVQQGNMLSKKVCEFFAGLALLTVAFSLVSLSNMHELTNRVLVANAFNVVVMLRIMHWCTLPKRFQNQHN